MNFTETNREIEFIGSGRDLIPMIPLWRRSGSMHIVSNEVGEAERGRDLRLNKLNPRLIYMFGGRSWQGSQLVGVTVTRLISMFGGRSCCWGVYRINWRVRDSARRLE